MLKNIFLILLNEANKTFSVKSLTGLLKMCQEWKLLTNMIFYSSMVNL